MRRNLELARELTKSLSENRVAIGTSKLSIKDKYKPINKPPTKSTDSRRSLYEKRLSNENYSSFSTQDILYFFIDTAKKVGVNYIVPNKAVDLACIKTLIKKGFSIEDILIMIEFVFLSEQDYLNLDIFTPRTLSSTWVTTLSHDSKLWLKDEFVPRSKLPKKNGKSPSPQREWKTTTKDKTKIGEW